MQAAPNDADEIWADPDVYGTLIFKVIWILLGLDLHRGTTA